MARRFFDSPALYFIAGGVLLVAAVASQFEIDVPSREVKPIDALSTLKDRDDLNVVWLLIDTLRADRMSAYGYGRPTTPMIDDAARYGIVFDDVVSQSSWTKTSMASLWTGTYPINNGILRYNHVIPDEAVMPAELFRDAGFRTVGLWRNGWVEPNFGFGQGFETYVRPQPGAERARIHRETRSPSPLAGTDEDLTIAAIDFLKQFGNEQRFFLYLHYMDIHQYVYDESSSIFGTSYSDIYDQSVHWSDRLVGALLQRLEDQGLLDHTLVVISADHGEAFLEHGHEGHARDLYQEVAHVPWIIIPPFLVDPGIRVEQTVANADVWPTILDIVGLPPLPDTDGRSMLPLILEAGGAAPGAPTDDLKRPIFAQISKGWGRPKAKDVYSLVSVTTGGKRLITSPERPDLVELYDHATDPTEQHDLYPDHPDEAAPLQAYAKAYVDQAHNPWGQEPREVELDQMRLNQLRALGYVIKP